MSAFSKGVKFSLKLNKHETMIIFFEGSTQTHSEVSSSVKDNWKVLSSDYSFFN